MSKRIFISYRRDDSRWPAGELYKHLRKHVAEQNLFMDVDSIPLGHDFVEILNGWVDRCDILLVLIGKNWMHATDPVSGQRRLDQEHDFVRIEIERGLARGIAVVPVLLDGAPLPERDKIPANLLPLLRRQAATVDYRTAEADVLRLAKALGLIDATPAVPQINSFVADEAAHDPGNVRARVTKIIIDQLGVEISQVVDEASYIDDLGADSLDTVELAMAFEEEFGIDIVAEVEEKFCATVGSTIRAISSEAQRGAP